MTTTGQSAAAGDPLPSWRDGPARRALLDLLERATDVPPSRRVAVFDNDGTLWCERPSYPQLDFFVAELRDRARSDSSLRSRPAYRALLDGDHAAVGALGLVAVAGALIELFDGVDPASFDDRVHAFFDGARHPSGRSYRGIVFRPMLELLDALRSVGITPFIVTGGGAEFVRVVARELYGIPPWHVVGTTVAYRVEDADGVPVLRRTATVLGEVNEGDAKVANVRLHLGVRPVLAAGNSAGDARMLDHALGDDGDGIALLVDHDDAEREHAYESVAGSFHGEPVLETAARRGWTVVSMRRDWRTVFDEPA